jgi:hypothetical protein
VIYLSGLGKEKALPLDNSPDGGFGNNWQVIPLAILVQDGLHFVFG